MEIIRMHEYYYRFEISEFFLFYDVYCQEGQLQTHTSNLQAYTRIILL
jgi:hypothetical protein